MSEERWDTIDRYVVISSDSHAGADLRDYRPYLDSKWHEEFDAWADAYESPFDDLIHATAKRNWDTDFRMSEMDADGVSAEILFPNTIPPFFPTSALIVVSLPKTKDEFAHRWAGVQAHNRWIVDFVAQEPKRRRGLAQIFPNDVDAALAEVKWAKETGAFGGVLLATVPPGHPVMPIFHECYEPLWALCEELEMPIAGHNVAIPDMPMDQPAARALTMLEGGLWSQQTLMELIIGGVFERHPNLKYVPTEAGNAWPMQVAMQLEYSLPAMRQDAPNRTMKIFGGDFLESLSMSPSEYVRRNVYYGVSGPSATRAAFEARHDVGVDHVMWGTDYPHEEGTTPHSELMIRWAMHDVPEDECRKMLAGNMADVYGFDLDALKDVAKKIGPKVETVHTELTVEDFEANPNPIPEFVDRPFAGGALLQRQRAADSKF